MKRRLAVIYVFIVLIPLALLVWMGQRIARTENDRLEQRFDTLIAERLGDMDARLQAFAESRQREMLKLTGSLPNDPDRLRQQARETPILTSFFRLSARGELVFPIETPDRPLTRTESEFLRRTNLIWRDRELLHQRGDDSGVLPSSANSMIEHSSINQTSLRSSGHAPSANGDESGEFGWYTWHFEQGLHLLFWRRLASGEIVGAELSRSRFLADLIASLPEGTGGTTYDGGRTAVLDADGRVIYQWGEFEPQKNVAARVTVEASPPLSSWKIVWYGASHVSASTLGSSVGMIAGGAGLLLALGLMAAYFYRESSRELREAAQRVNFVGQVSHELKTPLTNIRMYAELLEKELAEDDTEAHRDLDVIVSESQRLSRLIGNILTFSRKDRESLRLRLTQGNLDQAVRETVEHFRPLLESRGVRIELDLKAGEPSAFDRDIVEQILGNLLSNVEKYGARGGSVTIATHRDGQTTVLTVADTGPGIPRHEREKIFRPFYRVSDRLTDGVAGTGLGLALSRDLARLHGGDLVLLPTDKGACFQLTLNHAMKEGTLPS